MTTVHVVEFPVTLGDKVLTSKGTPGIVESLILATDGVKYANIVYYRPGETTPRHGQVRCDDLKAAPEADGIAPLGRIGPTGQAAKGPEAGE